MYDVWLFFTVVCWPGEITIIALVFLCGVVFCSNVAQMTAFPMGRQQWPRNGNISLLKHMKIKSHCKKQVYKEKEKTSNFGHDYRAMYLLFHYSTKGPQCIYCEYKCFLIYSFLADFTVFDCGVLSAIFRGKQVCLSNWSQTESVTLQHTAATSLHQSPHIDCGNKVLIRTVPGNEGGRSTETEVIMRMWHGAT